MERLEQFLELQIYYTLYTFYREILLDSLQFCDIFALFFKAENLQKGAKQSFLIYLMCLILQRYVFFFFFVNCVALMRNKQT